MSTNENLVPAEIMEYFTRRGMELVRVKARFEAMLEEEGELDPEYTKSLQGLSAETTARIDENIIAVTQLAAEEQERRRAQLDTASRG